MRLSSSTVLLGVFGVCLLAGVRASDRPDRKRIPHVASGKAPTGSRPPLSLVVDSAGLLPPGEAERLAEYLGRVHQESGVDLRVLTLPRLPDMSLDEYGYRAMRVMGVGARDDRRGVLVLAERESHQFRVEVGPGLEGTLPDGFVSYLLRDHVQSLFRAGEANLGVRLLLFMIHRRIRDAVLGEEYDPRAVAYIRQPHRLAAGAGVSTAAPLMAQYQALLNSPNDSTVAAYFVPQATPEEAHLRYIELLALPRFYPHVSLLTDESQGYMSTIPMSRAFMAYLVYGMSGRRTAVDVRDDLALIYYVDTPFISPHYLRRAPAGWQMDLIAEMRNSLEVSGGKYTWMLRDSGDEYSRQFADRTLVIGAWRRVKGGDNRPLPTRREAHR